MNKTYPKGNFEALRSKGRAGAVISGSKSTYSDMSWTLHVSIGECKGILNAI